MSPGRAGRRAASSSVAPIASALGAPRSGGGKATTSAPGRLRRAYAGCVLASHSPIAPEASEAGQVEAIYISAEHGELPRAVESVRAIAGKGLEGNRYFDEGKPEKELTLIEAEALEALQAEHGIELDGASSRRNVLTRGVRLNDLVGERFRVGELE